MFFKLSPNEWIYGGVYTISYTGYVSTDQFLKLPSSIRWIWSAVAVREAWGKEMIKAVNEEEELRYEKDGVRGGGLDLDLESNGNGNGFEGFKERKAKVEKIERGFAEGMMKMPLVAMRCVGYDWTVWEKIRKWGVQRGSRSW